MEELLKKVKERKLPREDLSRDILLKYVSVCGEDGKDTFERKVLPRAFKYYGDDQIGLVKRMSRAIERAGDYRAYEVDDYLSRIQFRSGNSKKSLEQSIEELRG